MENKNIEIRQINEKEREEIEEYLFLDEPELYSLITPYFSSEPGIITGFETEGQIRAGRKKFNELKPFLYKKICQEWKLCEKIDNPSLQDNLNLVVALSDILATTTITITGVTGTMPPFLIATILLKIGLRKFCNCPDKDVSNA
jgi:hypothetical protein